jgi:hypothetical protein
MKIVTLVSIIGKMINSLDQMFVNKKDTLLRERELVYDSHERIMKENILILKEQDSIESDIRNVELSVDEDEGTLKKEYRILVEGTNCSIESGVMKGNSANRNLNDLPTEGERGISNYSVLSSNVVRRSLGLCYGNLNQKITTRL